MLRSWLLKNEELFLTTCLISISELSELSGGLFQRLMGVTSPLLLGISLYLLSD